MKTINTKALVLLAVSGVVGSSSAFAAPTCFGTALVQFETHKGRYDENIVLSSDGNGRVSLLTAGQGIVGGAGIDAKKSMAFSIGGDSPMKCEGETRSSCRTHTMGLMAAFDTVRANYVALFGENESEWDASAKKTMKLHRCIGDVLKKFYDSMD